MFRVSIYRAASLLFAVCLFTTSALALSLDEAKSKGLVGEQPNGYLGVRVESPEAKSVAQDINARRKDEYQKIAAKNGASLASVEALAGQKAVAATPKGQYIAAPSGWVLK